MREASFEEVLRAAFNYEMINIWTSIPCVVITVYGEGADQRVDVLPLINKIFPDGTDKQHPPILNVPVIFPSSKTSGFTFPINKEDIVYCVFSQRGMDAFKSGAGGKPAAPTDFRKFDMRDPVAFPGLFPFSQAINNPKKRKLSHSTKDAVIAHNIGTPNEVEVRLKPDGSFIINSPKSATINAPDTVVNSNKATVNAPETTINATTTVVNSPTIRLVGNVSVEGNFTVASGYSSQFYGNVTYTGGAITHNGKNIGSTHNHNVTGIQTGGSSVVSQGPNT